MTHNLPTKNERNSDCLKFSPLAAALMAVFATAFPAHSFAQETAPATKVSPDKDDTGLPDLGTPVRDANASLQPGPSGISAQGRYKGIKLAVTPEYSKHTGVSLGVALASMLGDNAAVGILVRGGDEKKEILLNAGFKLGDSQQLILSAGRLKQSLDFSFPSGTERVEMAQDSAGVGYQLQLGQEFLRYLEVNGYLSRTASRNLADKTFAVDTATLYELWNDPRRIAGGRISGVQGRLGFTPLQGSLVKVSFGYEHLRYDLQAGNDSTHRPTAGLEWQQQLGQGYRLLLGAERFASQDRYTAGVERSLADASGRHSIGLNLIGVHGRDGAGNDRQVQLAYSYSFGRSTAGSMPLPGQRPAMRAMPGDAAASQAQFGGNLLDRVATRPGYMPSRVVAKMDTTAAPTRLVAVDKTSLPGSSSIDTTTGDVNVPLGVAVTSFAGITRNLAAFANTGQFALGGSTLIVRPSQMVQPAAGTTDSYVLTLNNAGGGTTSVTVVVSKGSVRIDSIVIASGDTTAPTTTTVPSVSGTSYNDTTLSATINETGIGYYLVQPAAAAAPTVAAVQAGSSFAMTANTAASVNISGLSALTDYVIYFVAKDAANNVQAVVQSVAFTTTAVADTTPDAFSFTDLSDQVLSTQVESNVITVAGINAAVAISVTDGEYQINGGAWTIAAGTVTNGQTVKLRHTTNASNGTTTDTTLTIGGVSDTFTSTTVTGLPAGYISQGGLTWMPNNIGPWTAYGYQGRTDWNTANTYCNTATINGQTGWRLPTQVELSSLYSSGAVGQGWEDNHTWTSTPDGAGGHYTVYLHDGAGIWWPDEVPFVTCVR
jgi:hypothetical protein